MTVSYASPNAVEIAEMFTMLVGKDTTIRKNPNVDFDGTANWVFAVYDEEDGTLGAVIACDVATAAYGGAALSLIPKSMAEDSIKSGRVAENLSENFREVLNVFAGLFNSPETPRLKLGHYSEPPDEAGEGLVAWFDECEQKTGFDVNVDGYGVGRMVVYVD